MGNDPSKTYTIDDFIASVTKNPELKHDIRLIEVV